MSTLKVNQVEPVTGSTITVAGNTNLTVSGTGKVTTPTLEATDLDINGTTTLELKHNGSTKVAVTSGGATVTGTVTATAFSGDGSALTGVTSVGGGGSSSTGNLQLISNSGGANTNRDIIFLDQNSEKARLYGATGDFAVDTDTLYVDAAANRVGIAKNNPTTALDVNGTVTATAFAGPLTGNVTATSVATDGIVFPATQVASANANTLDDYEEGTWTPTLNFGGNSVGLTYSTQDGIYTKIGRLVYITGRFYLSDKGSSTGIARVSGLPFTCNGGNVEGVFVSYAINMSGLTSTPTGLVGSEITLLQAGPTGSTTLLDTNFTNTSQIRFSGVYIST
jgi:hypothetical protein